MRAARALNSLHVGNLRRRGGTRERGRRAFPHHQQKGTTTMKVRNSLRSLARRDRDNRVVRRRGRLYVINKVKKRFKARQG